MAGNLGIMLGGAVQQRNTTISQGLQERALAAQEAQTQQAQRQQQFAQIQENFQGMFERAQTAIEQSGSDGGIRDTIVSQAKMLLPQLQQQAPEQARTLNAVIEAGLAGLDAVPTPEQTMERGFQEQVSEAEMVGNYLGVDPRDVLSANLGLNRGGNGESFATLTLNETNREALSNRGIDVGGMADGDVVQLNLRTNQLSRISQAPEGAGGSQSDLIGDDGQVTRLGQDAVEAAVFQQFDVPFRVLPDGTMQYQMSNMADEGRTQALQTVSEANRLIARGITRDISEAASIAYRRNVLQFRNVTAPPATPDGAPDTARMRAGGLYRVTTQSGDEVVARWDGRQFLVISSADGSGDR